MDFDEVVKKRKMIREYQQDRKIPITIIERIELNNLIHYEKYDRRKQVAS